MLTANTIRRVRKQNKELHRQKLRVKKLSGHGARGDEVGPHDGGFGAADDSEDEKEELIETVEQLTKACESYRNEIKKSEDQHSRELQQLQKENETLQLELCRSQERSEAWKLKCQKQENESVVIAKNKLLENENSNMKKDLDVLKVVIRRLNKEISFYQTKLRERYQSDPNKVPMFSSSDSGNSSSEFEQPKKSVQSRVKHGDDLKEPRRTIQPLLQAYDEIIEEKNEIIREHEVTMQKFKLRCQEIVQENEDLHRIIGESKNKNSVSIEEWQILYNNATLVLEENDLLNGQIENAKRKIETLENIQHDKVTKLKSKIQHLEEEKTKLKNGLTEMDKQCFQLTDQINRMSIAIQQRIPKEQHEASIEECKRLYNELKSMYSEDRTEMLSKIKAVDEEKQRLVTKANDLDAENQKLQDTIKNLEKDSLETSGNFIALRNELGEALKKKSEAEKTICEMMRLTESVVSEKEAIEHSYREQQQALSQMMHLRNQESLLIKECDEKVKKMQDEYDDKLKRSSGKLEKLEEVLETIAQRHVADIAHLKELINEKNIHIEKLQTEKRQLMDDLETVWKATTKDYRSTFSKSSKYKREHASSPNLKTYG